MKNIYLYLQLVQSKIEQNPKQVVKIVFPIHRYFVCLESYVENHCNAIKHFLVKKKIFHILR